MIFSKLILLPWGAYNAISPLGATGVPYSTTVDRDLAIVQWAQSYLIVAPNNAANYWTFNFYQVPLVGVATVIATFNTQADAANVWIRKILLSSNFTNGGIITGSSIAVLQIQAVITGAPGAIFIPGPQTQVYA